MRSSLLLSAFCVPMALAAVAHGQCAAEFTLTDFASPTDMTAVGNAQFTGDVLRLTTNASGEAGAAWYTTSKAGVVNGFTTTFTFRLNGSADGIAFVLQNEGPTALGSGGSGIGYGSNGGPGITRSLAVELDTFVFENEFPGDHVSIQTRGNAENSFDDSASLGHAVLEADVNDGAEHTMTIQYDGANMSVSVDGSPVLTAAVDLADIAGDNILDGTGCIYAGFTGSTGLATADQDILSWSFSNQACLPLAIDFDHSQFGFFGTIGQPLEQLIRFVGTSPRDFQWSINDVPLVESTRVHGVHTNHLIIDRLMPEDVGDYGLSAGNDCSGVGIGYRPIVCGSADYDGDGDTGTDADIEAFFRCLAGNCCALCAGADFNFDGDTGTDSDIEAFFRVLAGGGC